MSVLAVTLLVIQASAVSGGLTVLKEWDKWTRKLVCVSEDDGGGLIWNSNLNWQYSGYAFSDRAEVTDFQRLGAHEKGQVDCDLSSPSNCALGWNKTGWSLTTSRLTPLGPVFDHRWEGFWEHQNFNILNQYKLVYTLRKSGAFVVSIRGSTDAHMLFCDSNTYESSFCYWIIIGGWVNTESAIRECAKGTPNPETYPIEPACAEKRASYIHTPLSPIEWRTFVVTWNERTGNISVYDTEKLILSYVSNKAPMQYPTANYHLFLRSNKPMLFRLHTYSFLYTTDSKAALTSPLLYLPQSYLCVQMIIGLCPECQMEVVLVNLFNGKQESLEVIKGSTVAGAHGLPMWQYVQINRTVSFELETTVQVKLIPELERASRNPLWAFGSIRSCPPTDSVRYASMKATKDYGNGDYFWPNVTCQKLFYNENVVVDSLPDATLGVDFDDSDCPDGKVGPYCSVSCSDHFKANPDCKNTVICERAGCTCPSGFVGKDCEISCEVGLYGHDCKRTCGWCFRDDCDFRTGVCRSGCDNVRRYNIPPYCKAGIDVPPPPTIDFISETRVRVIIPAGEYKLIPLSYMFIIQKDGDVNARSLGDYANIFTNTTTLVGYTDDLEPGTSYEISCRLLVKYDATIIHGEWNSFATPCTSASDFEVEATNTTLTLKKIPEREPLHACPDKLYDVTFENSETHGEIFKGALPKIPHKFAQLTPYTLYNVTVSKGPAILFSREVRTLDGAPSNVRNVAVELTSNGEATVKWDPPEYPRGIIQKYEIKWQIQTHFGCYNLRRDVPSNPVKTLFTEHTSATLSHLMPYARYTVEISAHTSSPGTGERTLFSTKESDMPTAVYSNLTFQNYTLSWNPPEDCTTISGPIKARIIVKGVSKLMAGFNITKNTVSYFIKLDKELYGAEKFEARIYVVRDYKSTNKSSYQEITFTTPPKAPPPVRNLEVFEFDSKTEEVHLRWQEPNPPINGEIRYYAVNSCGRSCRILHYVYPTEYCNLWSKYICAVVKQPGQQFKKITVSAVNVNVSTPSEPESVSIVRNMKPSAPENFTVEPLNKGLVNVRWSHPWKTGGHLKKFIIVAEMVSSNLRVQIQHQLNVIVEHPVKEYRILYTEQLRLLPSSDYRISIFPATNADLRGAKRVANVQTPLAIAFEKELTSDASIDDSTISLHIPNVLNDTRNSLMNVIVKGPRTCEHPALLSPRLQEKVGIKEHEINWLAATFPTSKFAGKTFTVGDKEQYNGGTNCPLKPGESYEIMIIVQTDGGSANDQIVVASAASIRINEIPSRHEAWIIPVAIFVVAVAALYYIYRRRKRRSLNEIVFNEEMDSVTNTENLGEKPIPPCSKQTLTTTLNLPGKETLSPTSTPLNDGAVLANGVNQSEEAATPVQVKDFEDYVKRALDSGLLHKQYNTLPRGQTKPWDYGQLPQNKPKNRYANLVAYDENRVILKTLPDDPHSDYINANYIKGYKKEKCYIATQGPKPSTVIDFWRMIWEEGTLVVCMLANTIEGGKIKCEQYWPDIGKKEKYGDVVISNAKHNVFANYTFRTLHATRGDETRKIEHLHFTAWPDHGVPLSTHSVVTYLKKLLATSPGNGPVVVHCSAGVGRTGTIILCDICLRRAAAEGVVDVFAEMKAIRSQRANTVDTVQQYLLAHLTLVECLLSVPTSLSCDKVLPLKIKALKKQLVLQQQSLKKTAWQDEALLSPTGLATLSKCNLAKHRFPELVSAKVSRVYLKRYPPTDEDSDYISAVYVDSARLQKQYIATQLPLPATFSDFWRMIAEYKVELIVLLQPHDPNDATCCPIVPSEEFKPAPYISIREKETVELEHYTSQKLILVDNSEKPAAEQQVTILCSAEWKAGRNQDPPSTMTLVTLWQAAERISRGDGPTVVLCHDGVTGCGLYVALSFLLERMAVERECDVCLAIRAIRRSRPDFVQSLEQMEYLYDAAITYLQYFETYANFT
ncbi:receptor-type tyrosine-protein phosphatase F [Andrena cerasifolii]|uniref:receptor-type tyrosine-protein phosphatase F n=1 Tax=Andrena cerasifolii TaxID=2819439 RepID=UPI0040384386